MILWAFAFLYHLAWLVLTPLVLVYLWRRGRRDPMYFRHLGERFGSYSGLPQNPVWIHAVSLGEVRSAVPLARLLLEAGETVVFTHFTPAGRREAQAVFADDIAAGRVASVWVPLDMFWAFGRFFRACRPKLGLVMEIEIWPAMVLSTRAKGVPLYMCNAQYPRKSIERDQKFLRIRQRVMGKFTGAFVKSRLQAERFASAGVSNIEVTGELRFDQPIPHGLLDAAVRFAPQLGGRPTVTIASAVEGEDAIYIDTINRLMQRRPKPLIIYVPRAPERFDEVGKLLTDAGLTVERRTKIFDDALGLIQPWDDTTDVLLGDSMGEMYFYLALAQKVVAGGGFHSAGAHNIIEPLALGKPVVTGPHTDTIEFPFVEAEAAGVARSVDTSDALVVLLKGPDWASPPDIRAFVATHAGASVATLAALRAHL